MNSSSSRVREMFSVLRVAISIGYPWWHIVSKPVRGGCQRSIRACDPPPPELAVPWKHLILLTLPLWIVSGACLSLTARSVLHQGLGDVPGRPLAGAARRRD